MTRRWHRFRLLALASAAFLLLTGTLTGCGETRAIEDREPVIAVGMDPGKQPGYELWTFVMPNPTVTPSNISALTSSQQYVTITVPARSWVDALNAAQDELSRDLYLGQLQLAAWSTKLTYAEVSRFITALNADGLIPKSFWVTAVDGSAAQALRAISPSEVVPRYFLAVYFTCTTCHAIDWGIFGWQWWTRRMSPGAAPLVPVVRGSANQITVPTAADYRPGQPALVMPPEVATGLAYLTGRVFKGAIAGRVDGHMIAASRLRPAPHVEVHWVNGRVVARVRVTVTGFLAEMPAGQSATRWIARANRWAARTLLQEMLATVRWANRTHTDPMGYTRDALWNDPPLAMRLRPGTYVWRPLVVHVTVHVHLRSSGTVL
jgi:hypothetical protein